MNSMQLYGMIRVASQPMHAELANQVPFDTFVADIMGSILACLTAGTFTCPSRVCVIDVGQPLRGVCPERAWGYPTAVGYHR